MSLRKTNRFKKSCELTLMKSDAAPVRYACQVPIPGVAGMTQSPAFREVEALSLLSSSE